MKRIIVLGAGKIGIAAARMLHESGDYEVGIADAVAVPDDHGIGLIRLRLDVSDGAALRSCIERYELSSVRCPFSWTQLLPGPRAR